MAGRSIQWKVIVPRSTEAAATDTVDPMRLTAVSSPKKPARDANTIMG